MPSKEKESTRGEELREESERPRLGLGSTRLPLRIGSGRGVLSGRGWGQGRAVVGWRVAGWGGSEGCLREHGGGGAEGGGSEAGGGGGVGAEAGWRRGRRPRRRQRRRRGHGSKANACDTRGCKLPERRDLAAFTGTRVP